METKNQYKPAQFSLRMHEIERIIMSTKTMRDRMIVESLYFPALRREEVSLLQVPHIDFERGRLVLDHTVAKGGKISPIPVGSVFPQYLTNLKHFLGGRRTGYVFMSNRGRNLDVSGINRILEAITKATGMRNPNPNRKYINPHIFRHSLARHLKSLGFRVEFIQNYMRHSSFKTTMDVYGTLSLDEMEKYALDKRSLLT